MDQLATVYSKKPLSAELADEAGADRQEEQQAAPASRRHLPFWVELPSASIADEWLLAHLAAA